MRKAKSKVTVELIFIGQFTSDFNPLVGVLSTEDEAMKLYQATSEHTISWETMHVPDATEQLPDGAPLWVLIQGGIFADTAHTSPSPVAVFSTFQEAHTEREKRKKCFGEDLLLWTLSLGTIDLSAPDWSIDSP